MSGVWVYKKRENKHEKKKKKGIKNGCWCEGSEEYFACECDCEKNCVHHTSGSLCSALTLQCDVLRTAAGAQRAKNILNVSNAMVRQQHVLGRTQPISR